MFARTLQYPTAVASNDDAGVLAAMQWCRGHLAADDTLSVWTYLKVNLRAGERLHRFVNEYSNVEHVTGRGHTYVRRGPVFMAWATMDDIGELVEFCHNTITALCVIPSNDTAIRPWVAAAGPEVLGDAGPRPGATVNVDPIVVEALADLTEVINLNNMISAGYEKDDVVSALLALHDASVATDGPQMRSWVLAHGWGGSNPARLAQYVADISSGKRPRASRRHQRGYVEELRRRVNSNPPPT